VEGIGDHGCEYMTGGVAVILGDTGRNFGAGMSGGVAYVYDPKNSFKRRCNTSTFELEKLENEIDIKELKQLIKNHKKFTGSAVATKILNDWDITMSKFLKVMPTDYKRVMMELNEKRLKVS
jgi:glutamate synthase domain-containing protein 3